MESRIDKRNRVALAIDHCEINCVAMLCFSSARQRSHSAVAGNSCTQTVGIRRRQEMRTRHLDGVRIGDQCGAVAVSQTCRLGFDMKTLPAVGVERRQIIALENIQDDQRDDALAVGRAFENVIAAIIGLDRLDILRPVLRQVRFRHQAAQTV